ncbi:hypothetical protein GCM10028832_01420 [Streptomyces sparsus]
MPPLPEYRVMVTRRTTLHVALAVMAGLVLLVGAVGIIRTVTTGDSGAPERAPGDETSSPGERVPGDETSSPGEQRPQPPVVRISGVSLDGAVEADPDSGEGVLCGTLTNSFDHAVTLLGIAAEDGQRVGRCLSAQVPGCAPETVLEPGVACSVALRGVPVEEVRLSTRLSVICPSRSGTPCERIPADRAPVAGRPVTLIGTGHWPRSDADSEEPEKSVDPVEPEEHGETEDPTDPADPSPGLSPPGTPGTTPAPPGSDGEAPGGSDRGQASRR